MIRLLKARARQGSRTIALPLEAARLPETFRGLPVLDPSRCADECRACRDACPTHAILVQPLRVDLGACLFCAACEEACPDGAVRHSPDFHLAARTREGLVLTAGERPRVEALEETTRRLFGRSLRLRQVSAGGCNGCEAELNALGNVVFDLSRFGVEFVASPRHADGIVVTGPVTVAMESALRETYAAVPAPRLVIAVGACAISGGPFAGSDQCKDGVPRDLPVDLYIPGCPPHPLTILDGLLRLLGRLRPTESGSPKTSVDSPPTPT